MPCKIRLPENYDPYDMRLKVQFHPQADQINIIGIPRKEVALCCGAMNGGKPCLQPAGMGTAHKGYGRCKFHGGNNTGPKTPEGKWNSSHNNIKHGLFAKTLLPGEEKILEDMEADKDFDALDYAIKVQTVKIISYLNKHKEKFQKDTELEGEEIAYRKSRVICREGDGVKSFYHAGTIEDNALDRAFNTLRRLIGQKHLIEGKDDSDDDIMATLNKELKAASHGEVSISWGGKAQEKTTETVEK